MAGRRSGNARFYHEGVAGPVLAGVLGSDLVGVPPRAARGGHHREQGQPGAQWSLETGSSRSTGVRPSRTRNGQPRGTELLVARSRTRAQTWDPSRETSPGSIWCSWVRCNLFPRVPGR